MVVENGVLPANVDHTFFRRVVGAEFAFVPRHNRFAQRHDSAGGRVLGAILFDGFDGGLLNVIGRREVGFSRAEIGDVHALGLELFRGIDDRRGRRDLNAVDAIG